MVLAAGCLLALAFGTMPEARTPWKNTVVVPAAWRQGEAGLRPLDPAALPAWWTPP